jgi:hypothetical protein
MSCEITLRNARAWAARATLLELQHWKPCGADVCVFCDEVEKVKSFRLAADVDLTDSSKDAL